MSIVKETNLPGVGIRYELTSADGHRIAVVHHRRGRRELYIFNPENRSDAAVSLDLDETDTRSLSEMLGGSKIVETLSDFQQQVEGLAVDWLSVEPGTPYVGHPLGDARIRTRTASSVVAVIRGREAFPAPGPEFLLEADDTILVVGTPHGLEAVDRILVAG